MHKKSRARQQAGIAFAAVLFVGVMWGQSATDGKVVFEKRCGGCHALDRDKEGPRLRGVYGRAAGSIESFDYSDALKKSGVKWDDATLDQWLTGTEKLVPGNNMDFHVENAEERRTIIAFLKASK